MGRVLGYIMTGTVVLVAVAVGAFKYWAYLTNPWTRDGQVRAQVIQITPRVSGPIVGLPIKDNQLVEAGELLFTIDPRTFRAARDLADAELDRTRDLIRALGKEVEAAEATLEQYAQLVKQAEIEIRSSQAIADEAAADFARASALLGTGDIPKQVFDARKASYDVALAQLEKAQSRLIEMQDSQEQARADLDRARASLGAPGEENAQLRAAKAALETAELDLAFTQVRAPVEGYVTNLNLRHGDQAVANQPAMALVDRDSVWVVGYFKETLVAEIRAEDRAIVTLMSYPDKPLKGHVDSVGWGIALEDGSTGFQLLPNVSPTFEWIRLAQRIPVRVHLDDVPEDVKLRVGTTASVLIMTGTHGTDGSEPVAPLPGLLQ